MVEFEFDKIEEAVSTFKNKLKPGIHAVQLVSVEKVEAPIKKDGSTGSPYYVVILTNKEGEHEERLFCSEAAAPVSKGKLKHLFLAMLQGNQEALTKLSGIEVINRTLVGKSVWVKLRGEEKVMVDGSKTYIKASFAWSPFAEAYEEGVQPTTLTYSDQMDIKRLAGVATMAVAATPMPEIQGSQDLPF